MSADLAVERLGRTQARRREIEANAEAQLVRVELARRTRIAALRREADERHRRDLAELAAAQGPTLPAMVRKIRDAQALGSPGEQKRRERLQRLADYYAGMNHDTPETQAARRDLLGRSLR